MDTTCDEIQETAEGTNDLDNSFHFTIGASRSLSHTGSLCDYIKDYTTGCDGDFSPLLDIDATEGSRVNSYLMRNDMQSSSSMYGNTTNKHGLELIDSFKTCNMFIMNGRCGADQGVGKYTRVNPSGSSVIYYVFAMSRHIRISQISKLHINFASPITSRWYYPWILRVEHQLYQLHPKIHGHPFTHLSGTTATLKLSSIFWQTICQCPIWIISEIQLLTNVNCVVTAYTDYFSQACYRACGIKRVKPRQRLGPGWFDAECRFDAVRAGSAVVTANDRDKYIDLCRRYWALK